MADCTYRIIKYDTAERCCLKPHRINAVLYGEQYHLIALLVLSLIAF